LKRAFFAQDLAQNGRARGSPDDRTKVRIILTDSPLFGNRKSLENPNKINGFQQKGFIENDPCFTGKSSGDSG
jgi:hypothetical protein